MTNAYGVPSEAGGWACQFAHPGIKRVSEIGLKNT